MKKQVVLIGFVASFLSVIPSCNLDKPYGTAGVQQLPGTAGCLITVPHREVKVGGEAGGKVTATGPEANLSGKAETVWTYKYYNGCGGDLRSLDSPAPAATEKKDAAEKKTEVASKADSVAKAVVAAANAAEKNPALKVELSTLLSHTVAFYKAIDQSDELKPKKGNKLSIEEAISDIEKVSKEYSASKEKPTLNNWSTFNKPFRATANLAAVGAVPPTSKDILKKGTEIQSMAKRIQR